MANLAKPQKKKKDAANKKLEKSLQTRTYKDSNFRKLYKLTPKYQTHKSILDGLKSIIPLDKKRNTKYYQYWQGLSTDPVKKKWTVGRMAVHCWTVEQPKFYGGLKHALIPDDEAKLKGWMPFIRALNVELVCKKQPAMKSFRGSRMSKDDFKIFQKGLVYRVPYYVATSTDMAKAQDWQGMKYLITYNLPKNCPNGWKISPWSLFPSEQEVLLPPYTALKVLSVGAVGMSVEVLDNYYAPKEVSAFNSNLNQDDCKSNKKGLTMDGSPGVYAGLAGTACYELSMAALNNNDNKFLG